MCDHQAVGAGGDVPDRWGSPLARSGCAGPPLPFACARTSFHVFSAAEYPAVSTATATAPPFGAYGQLDHEVDGRVVCHVCGRAYNSVGHHAQRAHDFSAAAYRAEFGINRGTPLCSVDSSLLYGLTAGTTSLPFRFKQGAAPPGGRPKACLSRAEGRRHSAEGQRRRRWASQAAHVPREPRA
jgi:ROS/MUCR transcriptional regulator protein